MFPLERSDDSSAFCLSARSCQLKSQEVSLVSPHNCSRARATYDVVSRHVASKTSSEPTIGLASVPLLRDLNAF